MINVTLKTGEIITCENKTDVREVIDKLNEPDLLQAFDLYCVGDPQEVKQLKECVDGYHKDLELKEEARFFLSNQVRDFLEKLETVEISKLARKRIKEILKGSELEGSEYLS